MNKKNCPIKNSPLLIFRSPEEGAARLEGRPSFSLIELLITISIAAILLSIAIPRMLSMHRYHLIHELEKLAVTCKYLQQKALASNTLQTLTFDITTNSYTFPAPGGKQTVYKLPSTILFGSINNVLGPPATPTQPINQAITFKKDQKFDDQTHFQAVFFTNGQISPGAAYLVDRDKKVMGAFTCAVSQVSYIRVYLYENNGWKLHNL